MPTPFVLRLAALLVLLPLAAAAQPRSPEAFLGYALGERFTPHHRIEAYVRHVAEAAPERVRVETYGQTYEGRPLLVAYVTSQRNLARLEAIRESNLALAGLGAAPVLPDAPAVVWLSYNVHGNEAVSSEAALEVLYRLATEPTAQRLLEETVVILDPNLNPDGRDRYVHWFTQTVGARPNPAPEAREHREPWPGGRPNHYLFDLNRDWAWGTQAETRQRAALYRRWMPHVHADFHEQGVDEPYYFAPAAEPFHEAITPWQRELQTRIGRRNAATFDADGRLYFTRERFDLFYPSYGDTWPTFNGAVGMTYEQGGSGRAGLAIVTAEGDTLSLAMRIRNHVETSLNTVAVVAESRAETVEAFRRYFADAEAGRGAPWQAYVVRAGNGAARLRALARVLEHNGIRYGVATARTATEGFAYATGRTGRVTVEPGDLVVPARQPRGTLVRVLFEPEPALPDSLTYDITAWALPYAHGLEAYAVRAAPEAWGTLPPAPAPDVRPAYGYAVAWRSLDDARFLAAALREGLGVRRAQRPFRQGARTFPAGTLVITRAGNARFGSDALAAAVRRAAEASGAEVVPLASGLVDEGADFGSPDVVLRRAPRVLVLGGEPTASLSFGEVWHFMDERLEYPVTVVDERDLTPATLARYDVLVLPAGNYGRVLTDERLAEIRAWVSGGGRLVALGSAAHALAGREGFGLRRAEAPAGDDAPEARLRAFGDREREALDGLVPGAIFRVRLDRTHPLAHGYDGEHFALVRSAEAFAYLERGWNVGTLPAGARVAGFAGREATRRLEDRLLYGVEDIGRGHVVYLLESPLFRGFWEGGHLLFVNAVLGAW